MSVGLFRRIVMTYSCMKGLRKTPLALIIDRHQKDVMLNTRNRYLNRISADCAWSASNWTAANLAQIIHSFLEW